jgi:hypothetical protein
VIFEYDATQTRYMREAGWPVAHCPVGYHETFEVPLSQPLEPGVFFLGMMTPKRQQWQKTIGFKDFQLFDDPEMQGRLLCSPGVHLNIKWRECAAFVPLRVIMLLLSNRCCVVSERSQWSPIEHGKHYLSVSTPTQMARECQKLMQKPRLRDKLANDGYNYIKRHHRLDVSLKCALEQIGVI